MFIFVHQTAKLIYVAEQVFAGGFCFFCSLPLGKGIQREIEQSRTVAKYFSALQPEGFLAERFFFLIYFSHSHRNSGNYCIHT